MLDAGGFAGDEGLYMMGTATVMIVGVACPFIAISST